MNRRFIVVVICVLFMSSLPATELAISLGIWNLPRHNDVVTHNGTFIQTGVVVEIAPAWEGEAFLITEATPHPTDQILGGVALTYALAGPVYIEREVVPNYLNAYLSLGFMGKFDASVSSYGPFIRISPLALGGPRFLFRERSINFSAFYNIPKNSVTLFWNVFLLDFYL